MSTPDTTSALNIPQVAILLLVSILAVRWILSSNTTTTPPPPGQRGSSTASRGSGARVNPAHVETIAGMFPQLNRRDIMWDLQRNGGNVQATTERILGGGRLETPPISFQPIMPTPAATTTTTGPRRNVDAKPAGPDLIQRYNLHRKISEASVSEEPAAADASKKVGWSNNKAERQTMLQKRREEMILNARRKMEAKEFGKS